MKKHFAILSLLISFTLMYAETSAHTGPIKSAKKETRKEAAYSDQIFSESFINNNFSSAIYFQRGLHRLEMNEYEAAISDFNKAIDLYPFNADAYLERAYAKKLLGQGEEAIEDYQLAAYLNPTYKDLVF